MSIFVSLLGLAFLILIHEAGHFFVARGVGMNPRKFYLGFPPAVVKTKRNGIEYGVGAIPLGGYVKIPGMHRPAPGDLDVHFGRAIEEAPPLGRPVGDLRRHLDENDYDGSGAALERVGAALRDASISPLARRSAERGLTDIQDALAPDAYWRAPTWKRVAVIFAGPAANLVLAVIIFAALFMSLSGSYRLGFELRGTTDKVTATVNDVLDDTPAQAAGVLAGDRILAINGKQVDGDSIRPTIQASRGAPLTLTVERGGKTVHLVPVRPEKSEEYGVVGSIGQSFRVDGRGDTGNRAIARPARDRRRTRDLQPRRHRPGLVRSGPAGHGHLPLGARPDQPLARAPEPAAAAAPRRRPHRLLADRGDPRPRGRARGLRAGLDGRDRRRPAALLHRPHERHRPRCARALSRAATLRARWLPTSRSRSATSRSGAAHRSSSSR